MTANLQRQFFVYVNLMRRIQTSSFFSYLQSCQYRSNIKRNISTQSWVYCTNVSSFNPLSTESNSLKKGSSAEEKKPNDDKVNEAFDLEILSDDDLESGSSSDDEYLFSDSDMSEDDLNSSDDDM